MNVSDLEVGAGIPKLEITVSSEQVRRYAAITRAPGQRFTSDEAAKREGLPGQILPGNLSLSLFSRIILDWLPGARLEKIGATFRGLVFPNQPLTCSGFVTHRSEACGRIILECDLVLESGGERRITGIAVVSLTA